MIVFKLSLTAAEALSLDLMTWGGEVSLAWTKRAVTVTADLAAAQDILGELDARSSSGGGYDQPLHWYRSCKLGARAVRAAISNAKAV